MWSYVLMLASERHEIILNMLKMQHSVTVSELTEKFGLSIETIRRDLARYHKSPQMEGLNLPGKSIAKF